MKSPQLFSRLDGQPFGLLAVVLGHRHSRISEESLRAFGFRGFGFPLASTAFGSPFTIASRTTRSFKGPKSTGLLPIFWSMC
jgi:hypothetical protein